jgi:hypothetical protein
MRAVLPDRDRTVLQPPIGLGVTARRHARQGVHWRVKSGLSHGHLVIV